MAVDGAVSPAALVATLSLARWPWVAAVVVLSLASNIAYAVALQGTISDRHEQF
ncbi:MAG: hypothetical protein M3083_04505 [Actinomycetota bacterium]|nr:hypothetical protein [Actinomycetota bacterium]